MRLGAFYASDAVERHPFVARTSSRESVTMPRWFADPQCQTPPPCPPFRRGEPERRSPFRRGTRSGPLCGGSGFERGDFFLQVPGDGQARVFLEEEDDAVHFSEERERGVPVDGGDGAAEFVERHFAARLNE